MKYLFHTVLMSLSLFSIRSEAADFYVDASRPDDAGAATNWATAKQTIQSAVNIASDADTISVRGGLYNTGATVTPGFTVSNRVYLSKAVTLLAVDGPEQTFIEGAPATGGGLGPDATRGLFVAKSGATIIGFTFRNGYTAASGDYRNSCGGGLCCYDESSFTLSNCVFSGNSAYSGGGAFCEGTLYDCTFSDNHAAQEGGGMYGDFSAYDCLFTNNTSSSNGGGTSGGQAYRCTFTGNQASTGGGGMINGIAHECFLTNNAAFYGGGKYYGQAYDSTFAGNSATHGGGAYGGLLTRCVFTGNTSSTSGGGASNGNATDCTFTRNHCYQYGGGLALSSAGDTATRCTFTGNYGYDGGGMYGGTALNCSFVDNASYHGGGIRGTTARNCVISGNAAQSQGGGTYQSTAVNCTITGNRATYTGGGSYQGTLNNCIAWYNSAPDYADLHAASANYTCSPAVTHGLSGCTTNAPQLASYSHLTMGSPCIGAGNASYVSGVDIDAQSWASPPAMGCDQPDALPDGDLVLSLNSQPNRILTGSPVTVRSTVVGQCSLFTLDLDNGTVLTNQFGAITAGWADSGTKQVRLTAFNSSHPEGISITAHVVVATPEEAAIRVAPGGDDANDGSSWSTPKATIQAAVDAQDFPGGYVLVSNGTYVLTEEISVEKNITIRSLNGPAQTIIDGNGTTRCVYLGDYECGIMGFTITNGYLSSGSGAGVYCYEYDQTVSNCVITGNINESGYGGGMYYGNAIHCVFDGNQTPDGGGGGMSEGRARNCLFVNNSGYYGGGAYNVEMSHCTVVDNASYYEGGGTCYGYMTNCIVWRNTSTREPETYPNTYDPYGMYNCSPELTHGQDGNITNAPLFVGQGNYRLSAGSPCIDAGTNLLTVAVDLDGNPRIANGVVDMGVYEFSGPADTDGDGLPDAWESRYYGGPTNANPAEPAANGINTVAECYTADLDPTQSNALFVIKAFTNGVVAFDSSSNRTYTLLGRTSLLQGAWVPMVGPRAGTGASDSMAPAHTAPQGYYRLQVETP